MSEIVNNNPLMANRDTPVLIPYRPLASSEEWLKSRLSDLSSARPLFKLISIGLSLACLLILLYVFGSAIWAALGGQAATASEYAAISAMNQWILFCFATIGGAFLASGIVYYLAQPTHLRLTDSGIELISRRGPVQFIRTRLPWTRITDVNLKRRVGRDATTENQLLFFTGSRPSLKLSVSAITDQKDRGTLLAQLDRHIPAVISDESVVEALEPPRQQAYTELWLQALAAPPSKSSLLPLAQGARLQYGAYVVLSRLAAGGQGTAYLARDAKGNQVVLKEFLLPVYVDIMVRRQSIKAFENEARILQQLNHPGIVSLLDFFAEEQRGYLVLEYIPGINLKEKVQQSGPLDEATATELALQMCDILSYLHSLAPPVVHRDFTPDNLILMPDGKIKLIDFNVAQQTEPGTTGAVVGKHSYLAPEQFRGNAGNQSDIYSMGAGLHFLVTGEDPVPFSSSHPALVLETVSGDFDLIVATATNLEATGRYAHAGNLKEALSGLAAKSRR